MSRWLLVVVAALLAGCDGRPGSQALQPGDPFPAITLPALYTGTADLPLSDLRGKLLVLNVWAAWCPPCLEEMPRLDRLREALDPDRFAVIGLTVDERFLAQEFLQNNAIAFPNYFDADRRIVGELLQVTVFPVSFVIAPDGRLLRRVVGWQAWDDPEVRASIERDYAIGQGSTG